MVYLSLIDKEKLKLKILSTTKIILHPIVYFY